MKKKLLVFHPIIAPYRIDFFNELSNRFETKICLFKRNLSSQKFDYSKIEAQFNFVPTYVEKRKGFLRWIVGIIRRLQWYKPDIVLCSEFGIATIVVILYKYLTFKKYRIVSMVDDSYNMVVEGNQFSWKHTWATHIIVPLLDNVINVEPDVVDFYQKKYGKGVYMPIIVDDLRYRENLKRILPISESYVKKYGLEGKKVLLFVGRLVCLKNVSFAIKAFFEANLKDAVFVIVGDGAENEKLRHLANDNPNVIFTGRLEGDELYAWYNIAQIFTLPSIQEPFGAVTNEALLGGCFSLISKKAGSNCLIVENVNGNIIDPDNEETYIEIMKKAFSSSKEITLPLTLRENKMKESCYVCFLKLICQIM